MTLDLDKSTYETIRFDYVIKNVADRVDDPHSAGVDKYVGLDHLDPGLLAITRWGLPTDVEAQKLRFAPGDVIFGRRRAYQKKVGCAEFDGICSAHALVLRAITDKIAPEFLPFFISSDYFLDRAIAISVGSLSPTVNWRDLAVQEFTLPPIGEQRRLAHLLWGVEHHRRALARLQTAGAEAFDGYAAALFSCIDEKVLLGSVSTSRSGPSFGAADVSEQPVDGALPVLGITNTKPDGSIDMRGVGYVSRLPASVGTIDAGSLVLIRTNGNRNRIGNVYIPPADAFGYAVSAFQFLTQPVDAQDRDYLYWLLKHRRMQQLMSENASGSTGLGNLAVSWLNQQQIPWPANPLDRRRIVEQLNSSADTVKAIHSEIEAVQALTASMLEEVFG